jgi:hypothetical protein
LSFEPNSGVLWTVVNERDELEPDLVPDYITSIKDGAFYGWPYSYYGQHIDPRVQPQRSDLVATAIQPDYEEPSEESLKPRTSCLQSIVRLHQLGFMYRDRPSVLPSSASQPDSSPSEGYFYPQRQTFLIWEIALQTVT